VRDRIRPLWEINDLNATEQRFRVLLERETSDGGRAEVLTQLARVEGLRGRFGEGDRLVDEAESLGGSSVAAQVRIRLERGRLRRSSGDPEASLPLFASAFALAVAGGEAFLAADAAHMAALVAPDRDGLLEWTRRGIELAEAELDAAYWLGPLYNNLGWEYYDAGEYESALDAFERALGARRARTGSRRGDPGREVRGREDVARDSSGSAGLSSSSLDSTSRCS
jgi:tetratricopeptide (TPR) repeat protein